VVGHGELMRRVVAVRGGALAVDGAGNVAGGVKVVLAVEQGAVRTAGGQVGQPVGVVVAVGVVWPRCRVSLSLRLA